MRHSATFCNYRATFSPKTHTGSLKTHAFGVRSRPVFYLSWPGARPKTSPFCVRHFAIFCDTEPKTQTHSQRRCKPLDHHKVHVILFVNGPSYHSRFIFACLGAEIRYLTRRHAAYERRRGLSHSCGNGWSAATASCSLKVNPSLCSG